MKSSVISARVVVGCDGTPASDAALRFAVEEARLRHARLIVVAAYYRPIDPDIDTFDIPDSVLRERVWEHTAMCLGRALDAPSDSAGTPEIVTGSGDPAELLLLHAADAVMLVIGSHHRPFLQRLLTHLTSGELLRDSPVPVTMVPGVWT